MSIYSGFPTRKDETNYNQLISRLLQLLQAHLLELLPPEGMPNAKIFAYSRLLTKMQQYEEHKYLPPKLSQLLQPLADMVGLPSKVEHPHSNEGGSAFDTPKQRINTINSNCNSRTVFPSSHPKAENPTAFKLDQERDTFAHSNSNTRKSSKGSQKKERKFHGSFYDIQERKIRQMHERYHNRAQEVNERIAADLAHSNHRSQTESPGNICRDMRGAKYDPANKYGIVHMKALRQAQQQVKTFKNSTPKQRVRTQFL